MKLERQVDNLLPAIETIITVTPSSYLDPSNKFQELLDTYNKHSENKAILFITYTNIPVRTTSNRTSYIGKTQYFHHT